MTVIPERGDSMNAKRRSTMNDDPSQLVKAPGQGGDLLLTRGKEVEVEWPGGDRLLYYVDEGGFQIAAEYVGNGNPLPWGVARIVRVLTEDKPTQEPALPRRIKPEDVRVGMVVERRKGDAAMRDRVQRIDGERIVGTDRRPCPWKPVYAVLGWDLWLVEDAPEPVDPDAAVIERVAQVLHKQGCSSCDTGEDLEAHYGSAREAWREDARAVLAAVREHTVTARAEQ